MIVGTLEQIWQYPVKSMGGTRLNQARITQAGIAGDRCWAVIDASKKAISSAKKWPDLLNLSAALESQPDTDAPLHDDAVPSALIQLPNGEQFSTRDVQATQKLSDFLGKPAHLAPLKPAADRAHYKIASERSEADFATEMGLLEGEALPDFSNTPAELLAQLAENATPPGTYFDAFPLHLITTNSLNYLSHHGRVNAVIQRFRANFLVKPSTEAVALTETAWIGQRLQIGEAIVIVNSNTVRCSMPSREQKPHQLKAEQGMARAMVDHVDRQLGVNMLVEKVGACRVGDQIRLLS